MNLWRSLKMSNQEKVLQLGIFFDEAKNTYKEHNMLEYFTEPFQLLFYEIDKGLLYPEEVDFEDEKMITQVSVLYNLTQEQAKIKVKEIFARMRIIFSIFEYITQTE